MVFLYIFNQLKVKAEDKKNFLNIVRICLKDNLKQLLQIL